MLPTNAPIPENVSLTPDDGEADSEASTPREDVAAKKLEVLERQLEWDIMTRNEDDLSPEGVEYLRIQRTQILSRMRKQTQEQQ
ncbi:Hypothetical protein PHPALM_10972 [Phytophthora palmivora]|uniref:Uncharacterized protein n=1 Tax=Phytophthora palmivora TaxID=4796 RepID=A0A2P4Y3C2_9STRA|nr:Hypothetical protein PHPALM_10972 [Phytophthora palmivora]